MMDIEEFCDGYFYGSDQPDFTVDFTAEEVAEDAQSFFNSKMAGDHAKEYVTKTLGEF
jgi:hypothetical protein